ncbi:sugar/nucleoside kinase (ribokinase family) [Bacillus sp. SLBN-46]|jgi:ribokinase|uniref:hypothetical protein n=1 Tax=Bacillus sp. SLBN-46 TaxID=3042283 RepID=UPI002857421B|nr:hypothetical protein [Bacillus sp. SLBN-46]MDR6125273.1 sugar/nucleoside kinase (ribokinase family) [Bacillus sp. SLBN-46]
MVRKKNLKDAVLFATMGATISVTKMGAQTGMPYVEELEKFYELNASKLVL